VFELFNTLPPCLTDFFLVLLKETWTMQATLSRIAILFIRFVALLPLRLLYVASDILFVIVYYIVNYRRGVVAQNLRNSFPEKTNEELNQIARRFYRHFCDLMVETVKYYSPTKNTWKKHIDLTNASIFDTYYSKGKSLMVLSFHYGNWEWAKFMAPARKHLILFVYNPQRNLIFDAYFNRCRSVFGGKLVSTGRIYKEILRHREKNIPTITWLAADQTPTRTNFWTTFLNQETPFFPGPGRLAHLTGDPVLLQYMKKTARGRYKLVVEVLTENLPVRTEEEILQLYASRIEEIIRQNPDEYLWSHRRWKHRRPEGIELYKK
jgi:KDO2-lipid IV(A) lauroyltransferase